MKHLKTFENWFTNIFKKSDDFWQDYMDDVLGSNFGRSNYNALFGAAEEGNWSRFKNLLPKYKKYINDIATEINDDNTTSTANILTKIVTSNNSGLWEKKKMIKSVIDNGVDIYFTNEKGESFYDLIKDERLKKWFDETYPNLVEQILLNKNTIKYNL